MKKSAIFLFVILSFLAACENKIQLSENTISFSAAPLQITETRADMITSNTFSDGASFGVLGYCLAYKDATSGETNAGSGVANWNTKKVFAAPRLFYKQKVEKSSGVWHYTATSATSEQVQNSLVRWYDNVNNLYTFFAYYPYDGWTITPNAVNAIGEPKVTLTITDFDNVPDLMTAKLIDTKQGGGMVKFNFEHHLTGLKMRFTNYREEAVTINSIAFEGSVYNQLSVDLYGRTVATDGSATLPTWNFTGELPVVTTGATTATSVSTSPVYLLSNGENFGNNLKINITTTIADHPTQTIHLYDVKNDGDTSNDGGAYLNFGPQPGIIYTIDVAFIGGDAVVIQVVADNNEIWEGGTDTDSDITFE